MKISFITGLVTFWTIIIAIMVAGLVSYENQKATTALRHDVEENSGLGGVGSLDTVAVTEGSNEPLKTVTAEYMTSAYVANHNSPRDCWLIVSDKIYDVTEYTPFHPGGEQKITDNCGTDSTTLFTTNGGEGHKHSGSATSLLQNYYVADLNAVIPGTERTIASETTGEATTGATAPATTEITTGAVGQSKFSVGDRVEATDAVSVRKQAGTAGEKIVSEFLAARGTVKGVSKWVDGGWWAYVTYTDGKTGWSSEAYLKKVTDAPVVAAPAVTTTSLTTTSVATHNSRNDCYLIINNKVYDVTDYIPFHPGGTSAITNYCGKEATTAFNTRGGDGSHSTNAHALLANYYIGALGAAVSVAPVTLTTDTTLPTISFQNPLQGNTISGSVSVSAFATDASGITSVKFSIDNSVLKTDSTSPYNTTLDTTGYANGSHTLKLDATDKAGNSNSASITVTISNVAAPAPVSGLTTATVATHNSTSDCYLIINSKVYDVTDYIPFHPGGTAAIRDYCGGEATSAFNTKGGGGGSHSSSANTLLANYFIGNLGAATTPVTPTTCSSFSYSGWGACQANSTQSRTVTTSSPSGCTGGSPVTTQACTYTPPATTGGLTSAVVATHNSAGDCYLIINNKVYDVTDYIPFHPGGTSRITSRCGTEATSAFVTNSGGHAHSNSATNLLNNYYVGDLSTGGTTGGTCTSFTYSGWSACQANSTQSRTVTTSSPSGCTGGSPVTTQACTYTGGGGGTATTYTVSVSSSGSFSPSSLTINAGDSIKFNWTGGDEQQVSFSPSTISGYKLDHEKTTFTRTFSSTGIWTFSADGGSGTVTVQ